MSQLPTSQSPPFLPLLVTGIAGVAGYNAFHYFRARFPGQVFGVRRADNWPLSGDGIVACDAMDEAAWARLFDEHQFKAVVNCEGSCKLKSCELDPEMAWRVNVGGLQNLLRMIGQTKVRLVHFSIDLVFSGTAGGRHVEDDPTDPVTVYGRTMVEAEACLQEHAPDAAILRISLPMGISFNGHAGAIDWIQSRFAKSKPATLYYDEIRTPVYTDCLNELLAALLSNDMSGLYHAGGPRPLSLFQIAQIVNRLGGYDPDLLIGCMRHEAGPIPPRAGDVTLDSSKLVRALGYQPFDAWPLRDDHTPDHPRWHDDRLTDERGSPQLLVETLYRNRQKTALHRCEGTG
ncbi:MAG: sugar nucleotide-binding protein [Pirellulaceae bacterium]|jgi:dTDP-4-dehydrorhamnose reductase|nr:sugar nucleotide-binding protein [Pirellulaceae bacterium]HJN12772.1 sugar nucleotide-binding protein [Pirellulaceae bacterium]